MAKRETIRKWIKNAHDRYDGTGQITRDYDPGQGEYLRYVAEVEREERERQELQRAQEIQAKNDAMHANLAGVSPEAGIADVASARGLYKKYALDAQKPLPDARAMIAQNNAEDKRQADAKKNVLDEAGAADALKSPFHVKAAVDSINRDRILQEKTQTAQDKSYRAKILPELEKIKNGEVEPEQVQEARKRLQSGADANNSKQSKEDIRIIGEYEKAKESGKGLLTAEQESMYNRASIEALSEKERGALESLVSGKGMQRLTNFATALTREGRGTDPFEQKKAGAVQEQEARQALKDLGWDDKKIDEYALRQQRILNEEKAKDEAPNIRIDEGDNGIVKAAKSAGNWMLARSDSVLAPLSVLSNFEKKPEGQGRDPYSDFGYYRRLGQNSDREVTEKALSDNTVLDDTRAGRAINSLSGQNTGQFLYNASASAGDSALLMGIGGAVAQGLGVAGAGAQAAAAAKAGEKVSGAVKKAAVVENIIKNMSMVPFTASGYESAYEQAREAGSSEQGAQLRGIAGGFAEYITEKVSLDNLWEIASGTKAGKNLIVNLLVSGGIEGSEEIASDVLNDIADGAISAALNDKKSDINQRIEEYMENGMSEEDAQRAVLIEKAKEYISDGVAGALSGLAMGAGATAQGYSSAAANKERAGQVSKYFGNRAQNLTGNTEYERGSRQQAEKYAQNPTQYVADTVNDSTKAGKEAKKLIQEYADREAAGERLSASDRADIERAMYEAQAAANQNEDARTSMEIYEGYTRELEQVPTEYRTASSGITEEEARKNLAAAAKAGDLQKLSDTYQAMKNSTSADLRAHTDEVYEQFYGMAEENGVTRQQLDALKMTPQDAYLEGLRGTDRSDLGAISTVAAQAYNDGAQQRVKNSAFQVESAESLKTARGADGHNVRLTGSMNDDGEIITEKGGTVSVADIMDPGARQAYANAAKQPTVAAREAYIANIKDNTNLHQYDYAFNSFYRAGVTGVSFEAATKNGFSNIVVDVIGKDTAKAIYDAGAADYRAEVSRDASDGVRKAFKIKKGSGTFQDIRKDKKADINTSFMDLIAKATGLDIVLVDSTGAKEQAQINLGKSRITVTEDHALQVVHELGEFAEFYAAEEYEKVRSAAMEASEKVLGSDGYQSSLDNYYRAYKSVEADKTVLDASREMTNDYLAAIMSTEKGQQALAKHMVEKYGAKEAKTLGEKIRGLFRGIVNSLKSMLKSSKLNHYQTEVAAAKLDENEKNIQLFMNALDKAIENYKNMQEDTAGKEAGTRNSIAIPKVQPMTITTDELNANLHKVHSMSSVASVGFYRMKDTKAGAVDEAYDHLINSLGKENMHADSPRIGRVDIARNGIKDVFKHGNREQRGALLDAIKPVIENGLVVCADRSHDNGNYNTAVIVAPVTFTNDGYKNDKPGTYFVGVSVKRKPADNVRNQGIHVVDVLTVKKGSRRAVPPLAGGRSEAEIPSLNEILEHVAEDVNIFEGENRTIHFSLDVDTEGNKLSPGQQDYFKDSKIRDAAGNLIPVYHGSPYGGFTIFRKGLSYFSPSKEYADRYQNPSASSIRNHHDAASSPMTYKGYVNITHPFDIADPETRKLFIEEYVKGGYAQGINPHLSRAEIEERLKDGIDWTEAENIKDFIDENGLDYDGIILDEGASGGYGQEVVDHGISYVTFSPNQFKNIDNENPTDNDDIRFSLDVPVEEAGDLIAVHNMTTEQLMKTLDLGGFPMPSIAVTKADLGHDMYGNISVLFYKDTIDPKANKNNKVYSGDAYTPEFPNVGYKINKDKVWDIEERLKKLLGDKYDLFEYMGIDPDNVSDIIERNGGDVVSGYGRKEGLKYAFAKDNGFDIEVPTMEETLTSMFDNEEVKYIALMFTPEEALKIYQNSGSYNDLVKDGRMQKIVDKINAFEKKKYGRLYEKAKTTELEPYKFDNLMNAIVKYQRNGIKPRLDKLAFSNAIDDVVNAHRAEYEKWITDLFDGVVEKKGIRNKKDTFTSSGNRRGWDSLYDDFTLANIVKAMRGDDQTGKGFGGYSFFGSVNREYSSLDDIRSDKGRLQKIDDEEYKKLQQEISDELHDLAKHLKPNAGYDEYSIMSDIAEAAAKYKTKSSMKNWLSQWYKVTEDDMDEIMGLIEKARSLPTGYFEAKPRRAVGFEEIASVVLPDLETDLMKALGEKNIPYRTYKAGDKEARKAAVNSVGGIRFSIDVEDERVFYVRSTEVVKNPTSKEYQQMREDILEERPWLRGTGEPLFRHTYDEEGNEYYWDALGGLHSQIEPYINKKYGTRTSQQYEWWTRDDKDEWPADYSNRYSLEVDTDGKPFVNVKEDIISGIEDDEQIKEYVREYIKEYLPSINMSGFVFPVSKDGRKEYVGSKTTRYLERHLHNMFTDKMRAAANLEEIVNAADNYQYEAKNHERKNDIIGFVRGNVRIKVGNNGYTADVLLADRKDAGLMFFDIVSLTPAKIEASGVPISQKDFNSLPNASQENVLQSGGDVNNFIENIRHSFDVDPFWSSDEFLNMHHEEGGVDLTELGSILEDGLAAIKGTEVDTKQVRRIATKLRKESFSKINIKEFSNMLEKAFAYMQTQEHVNYADMMRIFNEIARPVIDQATGAEDWDPYNDFVGAIGKHKIRLTDTQQAEARSAFGTYGAYRNAVMPLNISTKNSTSLDALWQTLVEESGYVLDPDTPEGDQPLALYDALTSLRPAPANIYDMHGGNSDEVAQNLAMRIVEEYLNAQSNERAREAAKRMFEKGKEYRARVRERYEKRLKEAKAELRETVALKLDKRDAENMEKLAELRARNRKDAQRLRDAVESRHQKEMITKKAKRLATWVMEPTDKNHVPEEMKEPVLQFLYALDFVEPEVVFKKGDKNGEYQARILNHTMIDENGHRQMIFDTIYGNSREDVLWQFRNRLHSGMGSQAQRSWTERMQQLQDMLNRVKGGEQFEYADMDSIAMMFDEELTEEFADMLARNRGKASINSLDVKDYQLINKALDHIAHAIEKSNEAITMNEKIEELATETITHAQALRQPKNHSRLFNMLTKNMGVDMMNPETFFSLQGKSGEKIYRSLTEALNKKILDVKATQDYMAEALKGIDKKEMRRMRREIHRFQVHDGVIELTTAQIMSIYEMNKRKQATLHYRGGIKADTIKVKNKGITQEQNQSKPVHLTPFDVADIISVLTDEQKELADKMQKFLAGQCAQWGNEASLKMYGYLKFTDPNYFPINTDKTTIAKNNQNTAKQSLNGIEHMGMTRKVNEFAKNPILIRDIFDVFTDHITDMATYHGYAPAIKDANRWFNYKELFPDMGDNEFVSFVTVQQAVNTNIGRMDNEGVNYYTKLIQDINGAEKSGEISTFWDNLIGNYKAAAVAGNLRVVIQQPTAFMRAANMIDAKYLAASLPSAVTAGKNIQRIKELSPIAWWKSQGYFETSLGKSIESIVTGDTSVKDEIIDKSMWLAGKADDITWSVLYSAVEKEQRDKAGDISEEEYRKRVNERFDDLIAQTQVVDVTIQKSQWMRATGGLTKMRTAFMAEPTKSYNMAMKAMIEDQRTYGNNIAKWKLTRKATVVLILTDMLTSLAQAIMDGVRYKGEDDDYLELVQQYFLSNMVDNINPLNRVPGLKDISDSLWSAIKGESTYGSSSGQSFDAASTEAAIDAISTFSKQMQGTYKKTGFAAYMSYMKALSRISGVPIYNLSRDGAAFWNLFAEGNMRLEKVLPKASDKYQGIYSALDRNKSDDKLYEAIDKAMNANGTVKSAESGLASKYKQDYLDLLDTKPEAAEDLAEEATRAYMGLGLSRSEAEEIIEGWSDPSYGYSILDKAIESKEGEGIEDAVKYLQEAKKNDKMIEHIVNSYGTTISYNRNHKEGTSRSTIEENVNRAIKAIDSSLDYDKAKKQLEEKAAEKAAKQKAQEQKNEAKEAVYKTIESGDGDYKKAIDAWADEGAEYSSMKSTLTSDQVKPAIKALKNGDRSAQQTLSRVAMLKAYIDSKAGTNIAKKYGSDYYKYEMDQINELIEKYDKEPW